jgi:GAG-pre-integrase domain
MSGDVYLDFAKGDDSPTVILRGAGCLYVEDLGYNLISVGKLANKGTASIFRADTVELKIEPKNLILGKGIRDREDSSLDVLPSPKNFEHTLVSVNNMNDIGTWHKRMAHMNLHDLRQAHKYSHVPNFSDVVDDGVCSPCREGKDTKLPFRGNFEHADEVGEIIHSNPAGNLPVSFPDRYQYMTTFTDDNSRHISVGFMQRKSQLPKAFTALRRELQVLAKRKLEMGEIHTSNNDGLKIKNTGIRIVRAHSDRGKDYEELERLEDHLAAYSAPHAPEINPISEIGNRTLFDAARTLLNEADLPACLWLFAIKHAVYVRNHVRHATTGDSPYYTVIG